MKITREADLPTEVVLNIECDEKDVDPYLDWAYRRLVNRVRIPGFRKGKAPRRILEQVVGREQLVSEALERAVTGLVQEAVKEESLEPFIPPNIDITSIEPLQIKATVPLEPNVQLGDYQSLRIERQTVDVGDEQVDDVIERLRTETAPWEPVDEPIQFGDQLTIDVTGTVEGRNIVDSQGIEFIPSMENKLPLPGFSVMLEGSRKGDDKTFTLQVPEDFGNEEYDGKECRFHVIINEVKRRALPDLDDEFAKGIGPGFDTLEALRESVMENLVSTADREAEQDLQEKAMEQVVEGATVEFADVLLERQLDHMWHERTEALQTQQMDMDAYLQQIGKTEEEIREDMKPGTREGMVRSFVLRKLSEVEGIEVTEEEVTEHIDKLVEDSGGSGDPSVQKAVLAQAFRDSMGSNLKTKKTLERLALIVQGKDQEQESSSEAESTADEEQGGE